MIVISSSLSLADVDYPLTYPVIGWDNRVDANNVSALNGYDVGFPFTNLANPSTNLKWIGADEDIAPAIEYVSVDGLDTDNNLENVDYLAIAGHNFGTTQSTLSVGYFDPDSPTEWRELVGEIIPAHNGPII